MLSAFRGYGDNRDYWPGGYTPGGNFTWAWTRHRPGNDIDDDTIDWDIKTDSVTLPEYFRFGYVAGTQNGDYTKAGKWESDDTWVPMDSGPS